MTLSDSGRRWLGIAIVVGATYAIVGMASTVLAGAVTSHARVVWWRWAAFLVSGLVYVTHIAYERFRLGHGVRSTAWHVAVAVGLGAFGLALAANVRELGLAVPYRPRMALALVAWPALTAVPAFLAALAVAAVLRRGRIPGELS